MKSLIATALVAFALTIGAASAEEQSVPLAPGSGRDMVEAHCGACHSLDYIRMNSTFMTAKNWDAVVTKMIKTFGAPIDPPDARIIQEYLVQTYGARD